MEDLTIFQGIYANNGEDALFVGPTMSDIGKVVTYPVRAATGAVTQVYESVSGSIKSTYFYLIGGIVIIGILAIFVLGAGTKFMSKVQGG